jgi:hypothetical protein
MQHRAQAVNTNIAIRMHSRKIITTTLLQIPFSEDCPLLNTPELQLQDVKQLELRSLLATSGNLSAPQIQIHLFSVDPSAATSGKSWC